LENVDDQLWNSLYWTHDATRPDRLAKAMNRIICQSATNEDHFLYNDQTIKTLHHFGVTQHDINRLEELAKQLTSNTHHRSSSKCIQEHFKDEEGSDDLGTSGFAEHAHVVSNNHSQSQEIETNDKVIDLPHEHNIDRDPWIASDTDVESNNDTRYALSRVEVDKYLREFSEQVYRDGNIIRPKPINVHLVVLSTLRTGTKLLPYNAFLRIQNNVHALPLRCTSKNSKKGSTTNHTLQLESKLEELTLTVERLANQSSQCSRQHKELENQVQQLTATNQQLTVTNEQLTNQSSQCNQERKKCQDSKSKSRGTMTSMNLDA
jgi:hypothetical protein